MLSFIYSSAARPSAYLDEGGRQRPVQRPLVPLRQELPVLLLPRLLLPLAPVPLANLKNGRNGPLRLSLKDRKVREGVRLGTACTSFKLAQPHFVKFSSRNLSRIVAKIICGVKWRGKRPSLPPSLPFLSRPPHANAPFAVMTFNERPQRRRRSLLARKDLPLPCSVLSAKAEAACLADDDESTTVL